MSDAETKKQDEVIFLPDQVTPQEEGIFHFAMVVAMIGVVDLIAVVAYAVNEYQPQLTEIARWMGIRSYP